MTTHTHSLAQRNKKVHVSAAFSGDGRKAIDKGDEAQNDIEILEEVICASCPPCLGSEADGEDVHVLRPLAGAVTVVSSCPTSN